MNPLACIRRFFGSPKLSETVKFSIDLSVGTGRIVMSREVPRFSSDSRIFEIAVNVKDIGSRSLHCGATGS